MQIAVHPALQRFIGGKTHIELPACMIKQLLPQIKQYSPELAACFIDSEGKLLSYVALFINNRPLSTFPEDYPLKDSDRIDLISSLVGG